MTLEKKVLKWFANGDIGISSECMALAACGIEAKRQHTPLDPPDFNRCLKLVREIPEIMHHKDKISSISKKWKSLMDNWNHLESIFLDEVGIDWKKDRNKPAEKTYRAMKDLGL